MGSDLSNFFLFLCENPGRRGEVEPSLALRFCVLRAGGTSRRVKVLKKKKGCRGNTRMIDITEDTQLGASIDTEGKKRDGHTRRP